MRYGNIILLNGASSSGKTSILHTIQDMLDEPYLDAGIDKFIWMLPKRYLERPLWDDVLGLANKGGVTGHSLAHGMHQAIAALSRAGNHVLADHVLVEPIWLRECVDLFCDLPAYFVGVRCPLSVLEQREKFRKDRTLGQARAQFELVHAHGMYDVEVDTSLLSPTQCAQKIITRVSCGLPPSAFSQLKNEY
jgi:chloramphenicol 3-O phosphotransferase